jgi:hypothetical protein
MVFVTFRSQRFARELNEGLVISHGQTHSRTKAAKDNQDGSKLCNFRNDIDFF